METSSAASEYDVYAPPFVPSILRAINTEEARVVVTKRKHYIDFYRYAHTFIGTRFLPTSDWKAVYERCLKAASPDLPLTEQSYSQYFVWLMKLELAAKNQEHEAYALYQVPLHPFQTSGEVLWALSVPGLREDSPHIESGDWLRLRQLWVDGTGALVTVPTHATSQLMGQLEYLPVIYRSWGGVQYDAVVYSVNRAQETVYLKADGLDFLHMGHDIVPMMVNVVFPPKHSFTNGQLRALVDIDSYLVVASWDSHQHVSSTNNTTVFGESPGAKYATLSTETPEIRVETQHNSWIRRMLFPTEADGNLQTQLRKVPHRGLFDGDTNWEQAHAVNDVCINAYGILPYLISGPPGTGKTKTLVELAMQLLNTTDVCHILICAPSEAAADTLALRLKPYLNTKQMLRLNRPGRADNEVPRELLQYCYIEDDMFHLPPFKKMMALNVVVTSCRDTAMLAEAHLTNNDLWTIQRNTAMAFNPAEPAPTPPLHWTALLIDEAAQATEIDVLPVISIVCPPPDYPTSLLQPRFVMAGDEHQLGPRTSSHAVQRPPPLALED
jgi:helicase MOV-10